jgi:hypothetical protein
MPTATPTIPMQKSHAASCGQARVCPVIIVQAGIAETRPADEMAPPALAAVWFRLFSSLPKRAWGRPVVTTDQKPHPRSAAVIDMLKPHPIRRPL